MQLSVKNYKISLKIPDRDLCWLDARLEKLKLPAKKYPNFSVLFLRDRLRISVFKRGTGRKQHCNLTGLKSQEDIQSALQLLSEILECDNDFDYHIDNITAIAKFSTKDPIILEQLMVKLQDQGLDYRLNREIFSGLTVRAYNCTGILYPSGSFVIVGGKSVQQCQSITNLMDQMVASMQTF